MVLVPWPRQVPIRHCPLGRAHNGEGCFLSVPFPGGMSNFLQDRLQQIEVDSKLKGFVWPAGALGSSDCLISSSMKTTFLYSTPHCWRVIVCKDDRRRKDGDWKGYSLPVRHRLFLRPLYVVFQEMVEGSVTFMQGENKRDNDKGAELSAVYPKQLQQNPGTTKVQDRARNYTKAVNRLELYRSTI